MRRREQLGKLEGGITAKIKHVTPKRNIRVFGEVHYPGEDVYDKSVMTRREAVWTARRHLYRDIGFVRYSET
jgi:hypothetical protein